jgi:O-antigen/teichoic acid export membrane protein
MSGYADWPVLRNPMLRRILGAAAANAFARVIRVVEQLLLIPLLLSAWGVDRFGEWIVLTSIAVFATLANLGVGQTARSDIVIRYAAGDTEGAARAHFTSLVLLTLLAAVGFAGIAGFAHAFDIGRFVSLKAMSAEEARFIMVVVGVSAFVTFYTEPLTGAINAVAGAATPNFLIGVAKACEVAAIAIALRWSAGPSTIAVVMLAAALFNVLLHAAVALRAAPWLTWRIGDFDTTVLRGTWRASLGFFLVFAGINLVNIHVPRLIVFHYFGAAALVVFTVLVTYTKTARNIVAMISQSAQVEVGRAYARADIDQTARLVCGVLGMSVALGVLLLVGEILVAPIVVPLWTHGEVEVAWDLLGALAVVALVGVYFDAAILSAGALNRILLVGIGYWIGLVTGLALALALLPSIGIVAVAGIGLLLPDLIGSFAATHTLGALLRRPVRVRDVLSFANFTRRRSTG